MRVLITGGAGYIGSVLARKFLEEGYKVRVIDCLFFGGESILPLFSNPNFQFIRGDIREKADVTEALQDIDAVVHLAAIVGDPACAKQPGLAREINLTATLMLYELAQNQSSVKRFIFASTCSNYGKMEGSDYINETAPLKPISLYAELKVAFEQQLLISRTRTDFIPTALRFATVYGVSPRMRFDLTVNEFTRDAALGREIVIYGEQFWRPYCHVEDLARACGLVLESELQKVDHEVFGVGDKEENYQKKMLAEEICKILPNTKIKYVHKDEDPRDYRVDFSKIRTQLDFKIAKRVPRGIQEIALIIQNGILRDPFDQRYYNS